MHECIFLDRPPVNHVLHSFVLAMSIPSQAIYFAFTFREHTHELVGVCVAFAPTFMPIFTSIVHIHIAYYYNLDICSAFFIYILQNVHFRFEIANFASRIWHIYCYHKQRHILKVYCTTHMRSLPRWHSGRTQLLKELFQSIAHPP